MAEMADMLKKIEKAAGKHSKIRDKIEALKKQLAEEEKAMQRERDRVNGKWMKKFASLAEAKGLNVYELDPMKIVDMVAMEPKDFRLGNLAEAGSEEESNGRSEEVGSKQDLHVKSSAEEGKVEP